jgi:ESS family glutamate:Na+ symporter
MTEEERKARDRQCIRSGYNLITLGKKISATPKSIAINILAFAISIGLGWLIMNSLIFIEEIVLNGFTDIRFFPYVPMFPMAMIGGLILQLLLRKIKKQTFIHRRTAEIITTLALDILIASAIATVSLKVVGDNIEIFGILAIAGISWILFAFFFLGPKMFPQFWFEKSLTNIGQSMGMTATGLMLNRLADPNNHSKTKESFAYKQLVFEPFMGGGLITASSIIFIYEFGSWPVLIISTMVFLFWTIFGLVLGKKKNPKTVLVQNEGGVLG